jgi:hypothetical protein
MSKAHNRAVELGRVRLAELLEEEIDGYNPEKAEIVTAESVYDRIRDVVSEHPDLAWNRLRVGMSDEQGLTVREFCRCYARGKAVYARAQRDHAKCIAARERLLAKRAPTQVATVRNDRD